MSLVKKLLTVIVIYIRVSSFKQVAEGYSLEAQIDNAKKKAKEMGLRGEVVIFSDPAVSASSVPMSERKGLMDCLDYIHKHKPSHLLVWKRDRLARDADEYAYIIKQISKCKTEIVFFGTGEPQIGKGLYAKMQESLIANMAEIESKQLRNRILDTRKSLVLNGETIIGIPPYGYIYHPETRSYEVDENEAAVVRKIYDCYLTGTMGASRIAHYLNEKGISSKTGGLWSTASILRILKNTFYYGSLSLNYSQLIGDDKVVTSVIKESDKIIPLVTKEEHETVQAILKTHNNLKENPPRQYTTSYLFTGLLYCAKCGHKFSSRMWTRERGKKDGTKVVDKYALYYCTADTHGVKCSARIKRDIIEPVIVKAIIQKLKTIDIEEVLIQAESEHEEKKMQYQETINSIKKDLQSISRKIDINQTNLENASSLKSQTHFAGKVEEWLNKHEEKERLLGAAEEDLARFKSESFDAINAYRQIANWENLFKSASFEARRALILDIVDKIVFDKSTKDAYVTLKLEQYMLKVCDLCKLQGHLLQGCQKGAAATYFRLFYFISMNSNFSPSGPEKNIILLPSKISLGSSNRQFMPIFFSLSTSASMSVTARAKWSTGPAGRYSAVTFLC